MVRRSHQLGSNKVLKGTVDSVQQGSPNASGAGVTTKGWRPSTLTLNGCVWQRLSVRIRLDNQQENIWPAAHAATVVVTGKRNHNESQDSFFRKWPIACVSWLITMGIFSIANQHIRFAVKVSHRVWRCCWLSLPAGNATLGGTDSGDCYGPAFAAREVNRTLARYAIVAFCASSGTFTGCIAGLVIIIAMIRAPLLMILVCCIWAGFCTWISSLVRIENSYAWGLAGYTALIIVITIQAGTIAYAAVCR